MPLKLSSTVAIGPTPITTPMSGSLTISYYPQLETNWCWSACAQMLAGFCTVFPRRQCDLADNALGLYGCCTTPRPPACNKPLSGTQITALLSSLGITSIYSPASTRFTTLQSELVAGRPVQTSIAWTTGGGHVILIAGAHLIGTGLGATNLLHVLDPHYGEGTVLYSYLLSGYGIGTWRSSWTGIR